MRFAVERDYEFAVWNKVKGPKKKKQQKPTQKKRFKTMARLIRFGNALAILKLWLVTEPPTDNPDI